MVRKQIKRFCISRVLTACSRKYRHYFITQLSGSTEYGYKWVKPLLVMYAVPPVVFAVSPS